jgi:nucleoside-diphosphate-sugar epimerase
MLLALTGATGFIGQYLLRELPKRGYRVRALLRRPVSMPTHITSAVIGDLARPQNMAVALDGVNAVIHSAGIAHAASGVPEDDYRAINTNATIDLARAARRAAVSRFIFLSSIRAQCGATADTVMTESVEPRPNDPYGKSKLAAEQGLDELDLDWVSLRPVLVYGPGVKGNMAQLIRVARSAFPLPLGSITARRSLLSLENLLAAIQIALTAPKTLRRPFVVADQEALTVGEMIAAMRHGLGRKSNVFPFPTVLLEILFRAMARSEDYRRLSGSLVADPSALMNIGWTPLIDTTRGLHMLMQQTE